MSLTADAPASSGQPMEPALDTDVRTPLRAYLGFGRVSAVYVFIALFILYSLWVPDTFLTLGTWKTLVNAQAFTVITALAFLIPLAAGAFNLAVGNTIALCGIVVAKMLIAGDKPPTDIGHGVPSVPAIAITLALGAVVGLVMGFIIVKLHIESFITTLGMSSVLIAFTQMVSGNRQVLGMPAGFKKLGTGEFLGLQWPVWLALGGCIVTWYVLDRTSVGRRVYATGGNIEAARLAGVKVGVVTIASLVIGSVFAALAGVLWTANLGNADPNTGVQTLLPAAAAAFLGSTQLKAGRINVWGSVIAIFTLAVGIKGLQLAGAPNWISPMFNGVALLLAVGVAVNSGLAKRNRAVRSILRLRRGDTAK